MRNLFNENEIILCSYIARFGRNEFNEKNIIPIKNRPLNSIKMKVQNIAAMLHEEGFEYSNEVSCLTGLPSGQTGRRTNWSIVKQYAALSNAAHKNICFEILNNIGAKKFC